MIFLRIIAIILAAAIITVYPTNNTLLASSHNYRLDGYYKNYSTVYYFSQSQTGVYDVCASNLGSVSNLLRLESSFKLKPIAHFDMAYNISPRVQDPDIYDQNIFPLTINPFSYRWGDLDDPLYPDDTDAIESFAIFHNLDRAFFTIRLPVVDILVGRQAIAWGSAHMVNPTDIIAPFTYNELDTEDRIGVDAVRVRIPIGFMGEVDMGYISGNEFTLDKSAFYLRGKYYLMQTDISVLAIDFRQNLLVGIDLTRSIGGAGFWIEGAWVNIDAFTDHGNGIGSNYFRLSTGCDYGFDGNIYGFIEYHFNQAGKNHPEQYSAATSHTAYREGAVYLLGKHYLIPGISWQISPLLTGSMELLTNCGDLSCSLTPFIEYNIAQNVYLSAGAFLGIGDSPRLENVNGRFPQVQFKSEFGAYPDSYYTSFRYYF